MKREPGKEHSDGKSWLNRSVNRRKTHSARRATRKEKGREQLFRAWFGADAGGAEIMAHQSPAKLISKVLDDVFAELNMAEAAQLDMIREGWAEAVGNDVAAQARPVAVNGAQLVIEVASTTWRFVLEREHKARMLARLRDVGFSKISKLRFIPIGQYTQHGTQTRT